MTLQELIRLAEQLSPGDRKRLIEKISTEPAPEVSEISPPRPSMWGILADLGEAPSAEEIDAARREAWENTPREDL
jgi:hypothetical protein